MSELLAFEDVDSFYGRAHILHGLSLAVGAGERVALLGRNGVGKTTVVNSLLGVANVGRGQIRLKGRALRRIRHFTAARAGVSVVLQGRRILANLSVRDNLILGTAPDRKGLWDLEKVYKLFPILRERADTPGTALSGGQQQMLAIGRALMACPELLILDEPTEGLAPVIIDELGEVLNEIAGHGTSIFLIEQNLTLVERVCHRYYVLSKGAVVNQGLIEAESLQELRDHITV